MIVDATCKVCGIPMKLDIPSDSMFVVKTLIPMATCSKCYVRRFGRSREDQPKPTAVEQQLPYKD